MTTETKTPDELRQELARVDAEQDATSRKISDLTGTGDASEKNIGAIMRLQTKGGLLFVRAEQIRRQLAAAERAAAVAEVERLRSEIQQLKIDHEAAVEATFEAVYPHLRFRDSSGHEWHVRRRHEIRNFCVMAHAPGEIQARIHDAEAHLERAETNLRKLDGLI